MEQSPYIRGTGNERRHYSVPFFNFDTRAQFLDNSDPRWDPDVIESHEANKKGVIEALGRKYGTDRLEQKIENFAALGSAPISIISHHNGFAAQIRDAYVAEQYYPALTATCALGERILNHLILDLRDDYKNTPQYRDVWNKESFDDWGRSVSTLDAWNVLEPEVGDRFRDLMRLRHRSIHFNQSTYLTFKEDSLAAYRHLHFILNTQFGALGLQRWFIRGTVGAFFIRRESEVDPFVRRYYLPQCPLVGPDYSLSMTALPPWVVAFDREEYPYGELSDEEFAGLANSRGERELAEDCLPMKPGVRAFVLAPGEVHQLAHQPNGSVQIA
jgi:hypothetical protein